MNNLHQEVSDNLNQTSNFVEPVNPPVRISAQELHKYVLGLIGVFVMIVATYPISMIRVAEKEQFAPYQSHLKSLTLEYKESQPQNP